MRVLGLGQEPLVGGGGQERGVVVAQGHLLEDGAGVVETVAQVPLVQRLAGELPCLADRFVAGGEGAGGGVGVLEERLQHRGHEMKRRHAVSGDHLLQVGGIREEGLRIGDVVGGDLVAGDGGTGGHPGQDPGQAEPLPCAHGAKRRPR